MLATRGSRQGCHFLNATSLSKEVISGAPQITRCNVTLVRRIVHTHLYRFSDPFLQKRALAGCVSPCGGLTHAQRFCTLRMRCTDIITSTLYGDQRRITIATVYGNKYTTVRALPVQSTSLVGDTVQKDGPGKRSLSQKG